MKLDDESLERLADMVAERLAKKPRQKAALPAERTKKGPIPRGPSNYGGGLATLVRQRRADLELSTAAAGRLAGVDGSLIWQLEVGRTTNPRVLVLYGISVALQVPFEEVCKAALSDTLAREAGRS